MTRLLATVVAIAWGLWFGGMIMLFVALGSIFTTPGIDRTTAGDVAAGLFPKFERMQLVFAALCLLATFAWWFAARSRAKLVLFAVFGLATVAAAIETAVITPRIETMRVQGQRGTAEFDRMHRLSSRVYMSGAAMLLIAGLALPSAIRSDAQARPEPHAQVD